MKRSRFSEEQIIGILKEHEAGSPVADLCRKIFSQEEVFRQVGASRAAILCNASVMPAP